MGLRSTVRPRVRLLYIGDAELARQCLGRPGGSIEVLEAAAPADDVIASHVFDILLLEHGRNGVDALAILRDLRSRNRHVPTVIVADWDENLAAAALALGASDYVVKSTVSFRAIYFRLHRLMSHTAPAAERPGTAGEVGRIETNESVQELQRKLAEHATARQELEQRLWEAIAAVRQAREDRFTDAVAAAKELAQRESGLTTKLKAAESTIRGLEQQVADHETRWRDAATRAAEQHATLEETVRRRNELESSLAEEAERRCTFETRLEHANEALRAADEQRLTEAAAFADRLDQQQKEAAANAARLARQRDAADERLRDAIAAAEQARAQREAEADAAARQFAEREEALVRELRTVTEARNQLDRRLTDAATALRCAEQRVTAEHHAGRQRLAASQAEFQAELSRQAAVRDALRQQLVEAQSALRRIEEARRSDEQEAAARLAALQADHGARLADAGEVTAGLRIQLTLVQAALQDATDRHAADMARAAERDAEQQTQHSAALSEADAAQQALRHQLASIETALEEATNRHSVEMNEAAARLADERARHAARMSEADEAQRALSRQFASVEAELRNAIDRHAAEMNAAALRLADEQAQHTAKLTQADGEQQALRDQLAALEVELRSANEHHVGEMAAAAARLAEHRQDAEARLAQAAATLVATENKVAELEAARDRGREEHASAMALAAGRLADLQQQSDARLAQAAAYADSLEAKLADAVATIQQLQQQAAIEREEALEAASSRQADFDAQLADASAKQLVLNERLQRVEAAFQEARDRHELETTEAAARFAEAQERSEIRLVQADTAIKVAESKRAEALASLDRVVKQATLERQAASEDARLRHAKFEASLREEVERRLAVEKDLYDTRMAAEEARLQFVSEMASATERHLENGARLEAQAAAERAAWDQARQTAEDDSRRLQAEAERLHQSLVAAVQQIRRLESAQQEERTESERVRVALESDLARHRDDASVLRRTLDQTRTSAQDTLLRVTEDAAAERARLTGVIADRERELQDQSSRAEAAAAAAASALAEIEQQLTLSRAAEHRNGDVIANLQNRLNATTVELDVTRQQRDGFEATSARVPVLQRQIDEIRASNRREFEDTPVKRFRCSRTGAILQANAALARMLGYDTTGELEQLDFAAAVFETADELQWLIDRCVPSRASQLIDTTWKTRDGSRIIVRVMAVATGEDTVDVVVEDVTPLRSVEEKLRYAQRMEAVARYGAEVAVTCHSLLAHVKQEGQLWLARMDSDVARYQGQLLFDDVARAAGYLGQLATYGEEQRNAPEVVEMNKMLRDLAPVLKRVAGDNIDIVLPKATTPLTLDVEARPVERMLVNVAAYGRERMPLGGRLMIDVDSVVVDREFVEKYPNVRPGAHVVLTVNEVRRADRHAVVEIPVTESVSPARASSNPGVELGTLQALISDCGGHLWMKAEPPGDMVLKIHLPRRILEHPESSASQIARTRPRWLQRAFGARH